MSKLIERFYTRENKDILKIPEGETLEAFSSVLANVRELPIETGTDGSSSVTALFPDVTGKGVDRLTITSKTIQTGKDGTPLLIFLPRYRGDSIGTRRFFGGKKFPEWSNEGIDFFDGKDSFQTIHGSALGAQHAYALGIRMLEERVRLGHEMGREVGVLGISYGANVLGAYISQATELPDSIVSVVGGSIAATTLQSKYSEHISPEVNAVLSGNLKLFPDQSRQNEVVSRFPKRFAAVINPEDGIVKEQHELWHGAAAQHYIEGGHFLSVVRNHRGIKRFAQNHLKKTLSNTV